MMKRFAALMMTLVLALVPVCSAFAASLALNEKFSRQLEDGSGLKGSLTFDMSGEAEWLAALGAFEGVPLEIHAIKIGARAEARVFVTENEAEINLISLYTDGSATGAVSELLPDQGAVLLPALDQLDALLQKEGERPSWHQVIWNLCTMSEDDRQAMAEAFKPILEQIDQWMGEYASAPELTQGEQGETLMVVRYTIPTSSVRGELEQVLSLLPTNEAARTQLRALLGETAYEAYFGAQAMASAPAVLESIAQGLNPESSLLLERTLTTRGATVDTSIVLPLTGDYDELRLVQNDTGRTLITLTKAEKSLTLSLDNSDSAISSGSLRDEGLLNSSPIDLSFALTEETSIFTDDDKRDHETTHWVLTAEAGEGSSIPSFTLDAMTHFHSKNSKVSPTTIQLLVAYDTADAHLGINLTLKTAAQWAITGFPLNGTAWTAMTEAQQNELTATWLTAVVRKLTGMTTIAIPEEVVDEEAIPTDATPADLEEAETP